MNDTTIKKVSEKSAPKGAMGQTYLVSGKRLSMRLWSREPPHAKASDRRDYETIGYVISGRAELTLEGQTITLEAGDSWLVPAQTEHDYRILEAFTAVEATAPPAQLHGRDEAKTSGAEYPRRSICRRHWMKSSRKLSLVSSNDRPPNSRSRFA